MTFIKAMGHNSESTLLEEPVQSSLPPPELTFCPGPYALIGARIMTTYPHSNGLAAIVDMGNDFPNSIRQTLGALRCSILFRETPERRTTRGHNTYGPGELRGKTFPQLNSYIQL